MGGLKRVAGVVAALEGDKGLQCHNRWLALAEVQDARPTGVATNVRCGDGVMEPRPACCCYPDLWVPFLCLSGVVRADASAPRAVRAIGQGGQAGRGRQDSEGYPGLSLRRPYLTILRFCIAVPWRAPCLIPSLGLCCYDIPGMCFIHVGVGVLLRCRLVQPFSRGARGGGGGGYRQRLQLWPSWRMVAAVEAMAQDR